MADCCSAPGLLPFSDALSRMLSAITPLTETENVMVSQALGQTLAADIESPLNVPPHDNSAMDGYAFPLKSWGNNKVLTLAGRSMAGAPYQGECLAGECIRIMTGAKLPQGCDTVEMQENCDADGVNITINGEQRLGKNIRLSGEDIAFKQVVFKAGKKLTVSDIGVIASLGIKSLSVYRPIKVALMATGDELKSAGETLQEGDIYESNSQTVGSLLEKLGAQVIDMGIIPDNEALIREAFEKADKMADVVISSGGVSVGDADYTKVVLDQIGQINFWKIAMKPGKPFAFGTLPNSYFFGLPGNPVSAFVTAHLLAVPALIKLQNTDYIAPLQIQATCVDSLRKSPGRIDFQRGIVSTNEAGELQVKSTGSQGSGILSSLSQANCYIVLGAEQGKVAAGEKVNVQIFDALLQ